MKNAIHQTNKPLHIRDILKSVMARLEERRRAIVRCIYCDKIELVLPDSREHKRKLCVKCLKEYGHIIDMD